MDVKETKEEAMLMQNLKKARAIAKTITAEIYLVLAFLLLLSVAAMPANAAMDEGASLYEYNHASGIHFDVQAVYAAEDEKEELPSENRAGADSKDVMLKGTYSTPVSKAKNVDVTMKGGVGVTATDTTNYTATDGTKIEPAFKVGVGLNYKF